MQCLYDRREMELKRTLYSNFKGKRVWHCERRKYVCNIQYSKKLKTGVDIYNTKFALLYIKIEFTLAKLIYSESHKTDL